MIYPNHSTGDIFQYFLFTTHRIEYLNVYWYYVGYNYGMVVNFALFYIFFGNTTNNNTATYFAPLPRYVHATISGGTNPLNGDLFYCCDSLAKKDCHYHIMETIK